jgi:regulator of sigma E protease
MMAIWPTVIAVLAVVLLIILVVGIHEFGHYCAARLTGVYVIRFSIGFGKPWLRWRDRRGTEYCLGLFPIGGYVKLLDEAEGTVPENKRHQSMQAKTVWQRMLIIAAGPVSNLLCAFILFWVVFAIGFYQVAPVLKDIMADTPAANTQLVADQQIIQADQRKVTSWREVSFVIMTHLGNQDTLVLTTRSLTAQTDEVNQTHNIDLSHWEIDALNPNLLDSVGLIPLLPEDDARIIQLIKYPVWQATYASWSEILFYLKFNAIVLGKIITGKISLQSVAGPLTLFYQAGLSLQLGWHVYIYFIAMLSVVIAVINLLPIPGLDGAQILYLLIEKIRKRPISVAMQILIYRLGMIVIILLCIQVIINDILRFIG